MDVVSDVILWEILADRMIRSGVGLADVGWATRETRLRTSRVHISGFPKCECCSLRPGRESKQKRDTLARDLDFLLAGLTGFAFA